MNAQLGWMGVIFFANAAASYKVDLAVLLLALLVSLITTHSAWGKIPSAQVITLVPIL